jgi:ABC-type sugar transport system substrate-binding protein
VTDRLRFVVALLDDTQEFQRHQATEARQAAGQLDVEVEVLFAENNPIVQVQQLSKYIQAKTEALRPHAILIESVSGEGVERAARAAVRAGIGWILINRKVGYLEGLRAEQPKLPIGAISTDQLEIGHIQGRQFRTLLPRGGRVLYVQGPPDTSAACERRQGAEESLAGSGIELKIIEGQWTEESGRQAVERWIRLKSHDREAPDVIGCQNDMMAVGARRALASAASEADARWMPITGVDGLPDGGRRLVSIGHLAATVVVPSNTGPALHAAVQSLRSGTPFPAEMLLPPTSYPDLQELARPSAGGLKSPSVG